MDEPTDTSKQCIHFTYMCVEELDYLKEKLKDVKIIGHLYNDFKTMCIADFEDDSITNSVEILITFCGPYVRYRHRLTNLKWVHDRSNGIDYITKRLAKEELQKELPYLFTRNQGYTNAPYAAQYVIGQIIARERFLGEALNAQARHEYNQEACIDHRDLTSLTVGILGVGQIGQEIGRVCKFFGMTVWGLTRRSRQENVDTVAVDVYRTQDGLAELLEHCDYVVNCLPSTEKTRGMLSGDVLSHCKQKKAVFVNIGRGDVVDDESLVKALRCGWLGGAILDTLNEEPLPASSQFWDIPGVTITPHIAAHARGSQSAAKFMDVFIENYNRFVKREPLHVGRVCKFFGMTVWGLTRRSRQENVDTVAVDVYRTQDGLAELLEHCDYVVNCLPSTEKTRGMLSGDVLSHCKQKKAVFVNIGRGDVVDDESLVKALRCGWLGGAILDTLNEEPLPASSQFWDIPGVTITPHIAAHARGSQSAAKFMDVFIENYNRFVKREPLHGIVDFMEGY